jgi:hypothetical protein
MPVKINGHLRGSEGTFGTSDPTNAAVEIGPNTPLRLAEAVRIAFPSGGMAVSGLRREIARGRLAIEIIAGKQFTTIAAIEQMRETCRVPARAPAYGDDQRAAMAGVSSPKPSGLSKTVVSISPQDALRAQLKRIHPRRPNRL